jgi:hypothetical protein
MMRPLRNGSKCPFGMGLMHNLKLCFDFLEREASCVFNSCYVNCN